MTDAVRVLTLFRNSGGQLVSNSRIMSGDYYGSKPIATYTARISDARDLIGCTCGEDEAECTATEHIRNVKKNWYQFIGNTKPVVIVESEAHVNIREIEKRIERLIVQYRKETNEWKRSLIKVRGTALRRSLEIEKENAQVANQVMGALI